MHQTLEKLALYLLDARSAKITKQAHALEPRSPGIQHLRTGRATKRKFLILQSQYRRELHQMDCEDAVKLIERVLNLEQAGGDAGAASEAAREGIEQLVEAVHGHARTLWPRRCALAASRRPARRSSS